MVVSQSVVGMKPCLNSAVHEQARKKVGVKKQVQTEYGLKLMSHYAPTFPCFNFPMALDYFR